MPAKLFVYDVAAAIAKPFYAAIRIISIFLKSTGGITQRKEVEQQLNDYMSHLEKMVAYRTKAYDEIKWISDHTEILRDETGKITQNQGLIEDITQKIQLEKQEQQLLIEKEQLKRFESLKTI